MTTSAYRPEPTAERPSAPLLWRPWMSRLATVLGVAASPAIGAYWMVRIVSMYPKEAPVWAIAAAATLFIHTLVTVVGLAALMLTKELKPRSALRLAWGVIVFPCLGVTRLAKWVAFGTEA